MDAINWRGTGEQYQPRDRSRGGDDRHADSASGIVLPWQYLFSYRYDHFCCDDVARVLRVDALSRLAADAREILSPSNGSFGDFFADCGNVYAICPRSVARFRRPYHARHRLDSRAFRRRDESNARRAAASETFDDAVSRNWMDRTHLHTSARVGNSVLSLALVNRRRHCLHGGLFIFFE